MQLKTFLKLNQLSVPEVARLWGINRSTLLRMVNGDRWPSPLVMVRAQEISRGKVSLEDWKETCRDLLAEQGICSGATQSKAKGNEDGTQAEE